MGGRGLFDAGVEVEDGGGGEEGLEAGEDLVSDGAPEFGEEGGVGDADEEGVAFDFSGGGEAGEVLAGDGGPLVGDAGGAEGVGDAEGLDGSGDGVGEEVGFVAGDEGGAGRGGWNFSC